MAQDDDPRYRWVAVHAFCGRKRPAEVLQVQRGDEGSGTPLLCRKATGSTSFETPGQGLKFRGRPEAVGYGPSRWTRV